MSDARKSYDELKERMAEVAELETIRWILDWDEQTELQPAGAEWRARQAARIDGLTHQRATDGKIGELLDTLEDKLDAFGGEESDEAANVREWRRDYDRKVKIPQRLVEEITTTGVQARTAWIEARKEKNFSLFAPWLEKQFELAIETADHLGYKEDPYDALIDLYEPGMTRAEASRVLSGLRTDIVPLIEAVAGADRHPNPNILHGSFSPAAQQEITIGAITRIGYDLNRGGIGETAHPFCITLGPHDVRFGTRYRETHATDALLSSLHEAGHGIYEQGLSVEHFGTPLGTAVSLGVHESQSRMWENRVGRSRAFWESFLPEFTNRFPSLKGTSLDDFLFAVNEMKPSLIRTEADELTYNLHILIRFEMETALINRKLKIADVPAAWNEKMKQYLGVDVPDDSQGCMQDIHWSVGLIGYFATYALGNIYSAQFVEAFEREIAPFEKLIRAGEYLTIRDWFRDKIHRHGRRYSPTELVERVTGSAPSSDSLIRYLTGKVETFYGVSS